MNSDHSGEEYRHSGKGLLKTISVYALATLSLLSFFTKVPGVLESPSLKRL